MLLKKNSCMIYRFMWLGIYIETYHIYANLLIFFRVDPVRTILFRWFL